MGRRCCGAPADARKTALLDALSTLGVALPDNAVVWGPSPDGWLWQVVDQFGHELDPPLRSPVSLADPVSAARHALGL